jgi:hypothetical protein
MKRLTSNTMNGIRNQKSKRNNYHTEHHHLLIRQILIDFPCERVGMSCKVIVIGMFL